MRIFSAIAVLTTAAVLSVALSVGVLSTSSRSTNAPAVVETTASAPAYGVWICQVYPFLRPLCRGY